MDRVPEAIEKLEYVLRIQPDHVATHNNLAIIFNQLGRTEESFSHWKQALQIDPDFVDAHYNFGLALAQAKRFDEAIAISSRSYGSNRTMPTCDETSQRLFSS
jgi:Tfp pilus assembly protein PilF